MAESSSSATVATPPRTTVPPKATAAVSVLPPPPPQHKIVGFHCVPPDLQEIGEGIVAETGFLRQYPIINY